MTDTELVALPQNTMSLLKSNQVVTSVWSAVKELVENSLDAGAKNIEVLLELWDFSNKCIQYNKSSGSDMINSGCTHYVNFN